MADLAAEMAGLLRAYSITAADLELIRAFGKLVTPKLDEFTQHFYAWLATRSEYAEHFGDPNRLARVQQETREYWADFFKAAADADYLLHRQRVGQVHARIGVSLPTYFAAMNVALTLFLERLYDDSLPAKEYHQTSRAITKMVHLDTAVVVDTFNRLTNKKISDQSQALMEMSTPVTSIWQGILMLPVVGIIDSRRAQDIMNAMLSKIAETRSRVFILDISGVAIVDTAVANHLFKITRATRLMGCDCTISGISPAIAQTMVEPGIEAGNVHTTATLRDALEDAFRTTGVELRNR